VYSSASGPSDYVVCNTADEDKERLARVVGVFAVEVITAGGTLRDEVFAEVLWSEGTEIETPDDARAAAAAASGQRDKRIDRLSGFLVVKFKAGRQGSKLPGYIRVEQCKRRVAVVPVLRANPANGVDFFGELLNPHVIM
jgi:hypothetical protein